VPAPKGNDNAGDGKRWTAAIKRALARKAEDVYDRGLDQVADRVVQAAIDGQQWAVAEVANRIEGKPTEHVVQEATITHVTVGNARTLANTLRAMERPAQVARDTIRPDSATLGSA
jgi:hypothetical protein